jgi:hypothetical protein
VDVTSLWDRTKHAFERSLEESRKASERLAASVGEATDAAKTRLEKARLERTLFKRFAELGNRVFERSEAGEAGEGVLEDPQLKELLAEIRGLDTELKKLQAEVPEPPAGH